MKSNQNKKPGVLTTNRFINSLEKMGMSVVKSVFAVRLFFMPVRIVIAKKNSITH